MGFRYGLASSPDGTTVHAAPYDGNMWRSTDAGQTWTEGNISKTWGCVTAAHGGYVFAAESGVSAGKYGSLQTLDKRGQRLQVHRFHLGRDWESIASSSDGSKCICCRMERPLSAKFTMFCEIPSRSP